MSKEMVPQTPVVRERVPTRSDGEAEPSGQCQHGIPVAKSAHCPDCDLLWHEARLADAEASVIRHRRKRDAAIAAISRTCGAA